MAIDLVPNDWVDLRPAAGSDLPALQNVAAGTTCCWFITDEVAAAKSLIGISIGSAGATNLSRLTLAKTATQLQGGARALDADANTVQNTGTIAVATVYFGILRVQYTAATAQLRLYTPGGTMSEWSGSLGSMTAGNTSNTASRNASIGAEDNGSGSFVDGKIWDVRLYDRYLSDVECDAIFATRGADDILEGLQHRFMLNQFAPGAVIGTTVGLLGDCAVRNLKQQSAIGSPTGAEQGALLRRSA